jgi:hypothetical protein
MHEMPPQLSLERLNAAIASVNILLTRMARGDDGSRPRTLAPSRNSIRSDRTFTPLDPKLILVNF